jgi:hypothetical protein
MPNARCPPPAPRPPPAQVLWLQDYLLRWPKTLIVVSHAREFLNTVGACVCVCVCVCV